MATKKWNISKGDKNRSRELAEQYSIPAFTAHLLSSRGYDTPEKISGLLIPDGSALSDPMAYADMDKAVERISSAIESGEMIAVYGDYDADGVTATALLYSYLESCDANVMYMLPERDSDGYGLHRKVIDALSQYGVGLIVTVDNGISAVGEIEYAKSLGIDTVVTDHHQVPERMPDAVAVVDPHRDDCGGDFSDFAGVGVAFKLACAIEGESEFILDNYADLIALGTVADVVPLVGENRVLVQSGLDAISRNERIGLNILKMKAGLSDGKITASEIAFSLAPRINAAGRLGKPDRAVRLLLSDDSDECRALADELYDENIRRHELENEMSADIWNMIDNDPSILYDRVVVVSGSGWKNGLIGIFASRLCEAVGKPCFIITCENGVGKGSGRSVQGFSLVDALSACSDYLAAYGGHSGAAGLTIAEKDIPAFRTAVNEYAAGLGDMPAARLDVDCVIPLSMANLRLYKEAKLLEPFGAGNKIPLLCVRGCEIAEIRGVGGNMHQRLTLRYGEHTAEAMYFRMRSDCFPYSKGDRVDCVFELSYREDGYGRSEEDNITRIIKDIRLSGFDEDGAIYAERAFERLLRNEELSPEDKKALTPDRSCFRTVYSYLVQKKGFRGELSMLYMRLRALDPTVTYPAMLTALEAMRQQGLIRLRTRGNLSSVIPADAGGKVDLLSSEVMKRLN